MADTLNEQVRAFWEKEPCGTGPLVTGGIEPGSLAWCERVEERRYANEPFIHAVAQFTRYRGKRVLEIGVGAGTDHLQWARAGARCWGVDLTEAAVEATRRRLALHGLASELQRVDAEGLPFADQFFDLVWSWGVIHHAPHPDRVVAQIHRVLKPGGEFRGMFYKRWSAAFLKEWLKHALCAGRPFRNLAEVIASHFESPGTKAYTLSEIRALFGAFADMEAWPIVTPYDRQHLGWLGRLIPEALGSFIAIHATR
ncbi:MAG: class I SAM-dependent methyltransferase [Pseudomonadota bacterium]